MRIVHCCFSLFGGQHRQFRKRDWGLTMKLVYLLLHDFRFASIGLEEFAFHRFHFSKEYARRMAQLGHEVKLYIMADDIARKRVVEVEEMEVKAFNVSLQFPPM